MLRIDQRQRGEQQSRYQDSVALEYTSPEDTTAVSPDTFRGQTVSCCDRPRHGDSSFSIRHTAERSHASLSQYFALRILRAECLSTEV